MMEKRKPFRFALVLVFLACLSVGPLTGTLSAMPPVERLVLPNGLVLLHFEERSLPIVTLHLLVNAGSWRDPKGSEGIANLTSEAVLLGTSTRTFNKINDELDFMGSSLKTYCEKDYASITFQTLRKHLDEGVNLFLETVTAPVFPEEEIEWTTRKILGTIRSTEDQPGEVAEKAFYKALYLDSPYAHPVRGTEQSLQRVDRDAVAAFYKAFYVPNNSIMTVGGDISLDEVKTRLVPLLSKWQPGQVPDTPFESIFAKEPVAVKINRPISQANIIIGHQGISRENKDFYAVSVMNYILGRGGFSSRLFNEIRIKRGLAYDVMSLFMAHKRPGPFEVSLQTKNDSSRDAIALVQQEMELIQKEPVSERELELAKKYLIHSFPLRFDTQQELTSFLTQIEYYGLGLDYPQRYPPLILAVTAEDVQRVARTYLRPKDCVLVIVADLKAAGME